MPFVKDNFTPIGGQARAGSSPAHWSYESSVDSLQDIKGPGYFNEIATQVKASDFINVSLTDGKRIITVASTVDFPKEVIIDSESIGAKTAGAFGSQLFHVQDQKTTGTAAAASFAGVDTPRELNTILTNDIGGYSGVFFDLVNEMNSPVATVFSNDGLKMFVASSSPTHRVFEYLLTTPFDLASGVVFSGNFFDLTGENAVAEGIAFNDDGSKMFMVGFTAPASVFEYNLNAPFSMEAGNVSYSEEFFDITSESTAPHGIIFNNDGLKMFVVDMVATSIFEYDLLVPYSMAAGNVSYSGDFFDVSLEELAPEGLAFNNDGSKLFVVGEDKRDVFEYDLAIPFSLAVGSVSYSGNFLDIFAQEITPEGLVFDSSGSRLFVVGSEDNDVLQYELVTQFSLVGLVSLNLDRISLPAGDYFVKASAPGFVTDGHRIKLRDITGAVDLVIGTSEESAQGGFIMTRSLLNGRFTLAAQSVLELQHWVQTSFAVGFGTGVGSGPHEVYADVLIWKL